jgi:DNA polymerase-3 subunit epsilon
MFAWVGKPPKFHPFTCPGHGRTLAEIAILDLETTSCNPYKARIVEIGITIWDPDVNSQPQEWESLINPLVHIPEEPIRIHKISAQDIQLAPTFPEVAEEVARLVDRPFVEGHNLPSYDKVFLNRAFQEVLALLMKYPSRTKSG